MIQALIFVGLGTLSYELANVKIKKMKDELSQYQKAFILGIFGIIVFSLMFFITGNWHYEIHILSILLTCIYIICLLLFFNFYLLSVKYADRSTMALFGTLVLPLLLIVDIILGYNISFLEIVGIFLIFLVIFLTSFKGPISTNGIYYVFATVLITVINISIVKYGIENFASLESFMLIIQILISIILFFIVIYKNGFNGVYECLKPSYFVFGIFNSFNVLFNNIALIFGPPSLITTFRKVGEVIRGVIFGKLVFNEKYFIQKLGTSFMLIIGVFTINYKVLAANADFLTDINLGIFKGDISRIKSDIEKNINSDNYSDRLGKGDLHYMY